ncbi:adenine-specific DNA-methyltransferase [Rahnella inusitata]|nr:adenine-specific DNA-methyltransferase [Rahnella inusitata]
MSRLTDLIAKAKAKDSALGAELDREFKILSSRLPFGLNFERHSPEAVELPLRPIRKGDKVRVLPERGSVKKGDQRLWQVRTINRVKKTASLELLSAAEVETQTVALDGLVVVAEFRDTIYPGLISTGKVQCGGDKPCHTVINGENYHVLKALTYTHRGKVDAIYIDPPYNSGAKDWKYNNDYVESEDIYRHSKWLAMMERRLLAAKELLNPNDSVLVVTIDEKEYLRLGLLLEQVFPEGKIQMISSIINRKGIVRANEFRRTNEFIYFVMFGAARLNPSRSDTGTAVRWASLRRTDIESQRGTKKGGTSQFFPIYVNKVTTQIEAIGEPITPDIDRNSVPDRQGCFTLWPVRPNGTEMNWGLTPKTVISLLKHGYVKAVDGRANKEPTLYYLTSGQVKDIADGNLKVTGREASGAAIVEFETGKATMPATQWDHESHSAQEHGKSIIKTLIPGRAFDFPKSLYAIEDGLRFFVTNKPDAVILDFFSGSGTTAHAVMRLNRQDGGRRQCISVTNNEVAAEEQKKLREQGLLPGDPDWEKWGICDYITKPRVQAAITGKTLDGEPIKGDYKFTDEFPIAEGFEENAEFFTLTYETPVSVSYNLAFNRISPLLWLRAGARGSRIDKLPSDGWAMADAYGLLSNVDAATSFISALGKGDGIRIAYIVTDDDRRFQAIAKRLPEGIEPVRLYESYLTNFSFTNGE